EVRRAMWKAHVLVLSSRYETFGIVLIEAMATGLPTIATRSGGPESVLLPSIGTIVDHGNVTALAKAMRTYQQSRPSRNSIRRHAVDRYSENLIVSKLISNYEKVLSFQ
ncbi:MAG: glycosyltransferase family 4 protein, partial [Desulfobulbaceae bacterium]|nr:glycosyltransferase family 4 protein [Desulfobulbaceae bacterium]